jgi:hypothetical protein
MTFRRTLSSLDGINVYEILPGDSFTNKEGIKGYLSWSKTELNYIVQQEKEGHNMIGRLTEWNKCSVPSALWRLCQEDNRPVYLYTRHMFEEPTNEFGEVHP